MASQNRDNRVWSASSLNVQLSINTLLDTAGIVEVLNEQKQVILKPNLVETLAPPITTPVTFVEAVIKYITKHCPELRIIVGEGTGSLEYDTFHCFSELGYNRLLSYPNVELIDLNIENLRHMKDPTCKRWPEMYLPELVFESYLISLPVLKAHSLARVTLTMKNMMGCAPPEHFSGGGPWGKSTFHQGMHEAVFDLNRYRTPDFSVIDGSVGMAQAHLWGPTCNPPVETFLASYDPVAIDAYGTTLLKRNWRDVDHISMANGVLGNADSFEIIEL